jgi:hypothetical protein
MLDRIGRELRRWQLAIRMLSHQARTQAICDFTGLARERIKTLRREWSVPKEDRHRGPAPSSLSPFFRSSRTRSEVSTLAVLCRVLEAVPAEPVADAARRYPTLDRGDSLCDVFEAFRTLFPRVELGFEQLVLLATTLAAGEVTKLERCGRCGASILVDGLAVSRDLCSACHAKDDGR